MAFTQEELRSEIQSYLNQPSIVPEGHRGAFVTYYDEAGVRTAIAVKTANGWEVNGTIGWHSNTNSLEYGVNVMKTW